MLFSSAAGSNGARAAIQKAHSPRFLRADPQQLAGNRSIRNLPYATRGPRVSRRSKCDNRLHKCRQSARSFRCRSGFDALVKRTSATDFHYRFANGFAMARAQSMNACANGLRVRPSARILAAAIGKNFRHFAANRNSTTCCRRYLPMARPLCVSLACRLDRPIRCFSSPATFGSPSSRHVREMLMF